MISYLSRLLNEEDEDEATTIVIASLATLLFFGGLMWWFMTGNAVDKSIGFALESEETKRSVLCDKESQLDAYGQCVAIPVLVIAQTPTTPTTPEIVPVAEKQTTTQLQIQSPEPAQESVAENTLETIDTDSDGLADELDKCPAQPGSAINDGCPVVLDQDADGTPDETDKCLNQPGPAENEGCPIPIDEDSDGLANDADNCPSEAGPVSNNGCPLPIDTDSDGIPDDQDKCPQVAGTSERDGCATPVSEPLPVAPAIAQEPEVPVVPVVPVVQLMPEAPVKAEKTELESLADAVIFDSSSAALNERSKRALQRVASIVQEIPGRKLKVTAHTDSSGNANYNLALSHERALACLIYLRKLGIERDILSGVGLGETQPRASNLDRAGRRLNRRVEFTLIDP